MKISAERLFCEVKKRENMVRVSVYLKKFLDRLQAEWPVQWVKLQKHPLGFLALLVPLNERDILRTHLWDEDFDWKQPGELGIHDHVFCFSSAVLLGSVVNTTYSYSVGAAGESWYRTEYSQSGSRLVRQSGLLSVAQINQERVEAGSFYMMKSGVMHQTVVDTVSGLTVLASSYSSSSRDGAIVVGDSAEDGFEFVREISGESEVRGFISRIVGTLGELKEGAMLGSPMSG